MDYGRVGSLLIIVLFCSCVLPVIETRAEPESESSAEPESESSAEPESESSAEPESESSAEPESESSSEPESESSAEPESESSSEPESESSAEPESESSSEPESESSAEPESESSAEPEWEEGEDPECDCDPDVEDVDPECENNAEPESETSAEPETENNAEPESEPEDVVAEPENGLRPWEMPVQPFVAETMCVLVPDPGRCINTMTQWYYDNRTNQCREFVYGGCDGNRNRFASRLLCEDHCLNIVPSLPTTTKSEAVMLPLSGTVSDNDDSTLVILLASFLAFFFTTTFILLLYLIKLKIAGSKYQCHGDNKNFQYQPSLVLTTLDVTQICNKSKTGTPKNASSNSTPLDSETESVTVSDYPTLDDNPDMGQIGCRVGSDCENV